MRGPQPLQLQLTVRQQAILEQIVRRSTSPQCEVIRAQIILAAAERKNNQEIAERLRLTPSTVRTWRRRWADAADQLTALEAQDDEVALRQIIRELLMDNPRRGAPAKFTPEQLCHLVAVSCEPPADSQRPVSHWTPVELAAEVIKRGLIPSISPRSVGRFLKGKPTSSPICRGTG